VKNNNLSVNWLKSEQSFNTVALNVGGTVDHQILMSILWRPTIKLLNCFFGLSLAFN
jgi:hypothetical protein